MSSRPLIESIAEEITPLIGYRPVLREEGAAGGGCINRAMRLGDGERSYFLKYNSASHGEMFAAEADGLNEMAATATLRTPLPIAHGAGVGQAWLLLEWLDLRGSGSRQSAVVLGQQLAAMHRHTRPHPGWWRDNTIGSTPQPNSESGDWVDFYRRRRLLYQLELLASAGYPRLLELSVPLLEGLEKLIDHSPVASLLHGDLWGGNQAVLADGTPVVFDPACYYGDRESDLAMTELFGGFPAAFYDAYREAWPLDAGYRVRKGLYILYHLLNHANLFGGGYLGQSESMIRKLNSELGDG